jgi:hypothetical protein
VVFLAGPGSGGINLFAFNGNTGQILGATTVADFSNIRKWLIGSDGNLYVGFGGSGGGAVMRWNGIPADILNEASPDFATLFDFEMVGAGLDGDAAELTEHEGRIFTTTWPGGGSASGLWVSPTIPLTEADKNDWIKSWSVFDFEPDPVTAYTYGGGALASFRGWVYWGTMHVPGLAAAAHSSVYGEATDQIESYMRTFGTWRAISIFRGRNFDDPDGPEIELLYGDSAMMAYLVSPEENPFDPNAMRIWQEVPNNMWQEPLYGTAGFNNPFNNYCWTMRVYNSALYVGTMDHSYLLSGGDSDPEPILDTTAYGADLYRFDSAFSAALPVSLDGMGNYLNYGIRTMITDNTALYLGTANPMNLNPDGGWELIKLISSGPQTVPNCVGKTQAAAQEAILGADLSIGNISSECGSTEEAGIIISQNIPAGTKVGAGTEVDLVVSSGPCPIVPNCLGLTEAEARTTIRNAGLSEFIYGACNRMAPVGTVVDQNPVAGTPVSPGSAISLVVSTGPCPLDMRDRTNRRISNR